MLQECADPEKRMFGTQLRRKLEKTKGATKTEVNTEETAGTNNEK